MNKHPNIFEYATSELTQDAVLCWLLAWAKPEYASASDGLHQIGRDLVRLVFSRAGRDLPEPIMEIEVQRQVAHIDILCIVNKSIAIVIEDKAGTREHSGQLTRYISEVRKYLKSDALEVLGIYVQSGDQSDYNEVLRSGFAVVTRRDLLEVLETTNAKDAAATSDILRQFTERLRRIEDDVMSYQSLPIDKWTWGSWTGFYSHLQASLGDGKWEYVSNPSGGFLGFWWHATPIDGCVAYLLLQNETLRFKIELPPGGDRPAIRDRWSRLVVKQAEICKLAVSRPGRFGAGNTMTVAILSRDPRCCSADGLIDIAATIDVLKSAQFVLDRCCAELTPIGS